MKDLLKDYELIRRSGICNMFDYQCVMRVAKELNLPLSTLTMKEYAALLKHLMSKGEEA